MAIESACDSNDPEAEPNYAGPAAFGSAGGRRGLALTTMPHRIALPAAGLRAFFQILSIDTQSSLALVSPRV